MLKLILFQQLKIHVFIAFLADVHRNDDIRLLIIRHTAESFHVLQEFFDKGLYFGLVEFAILAVLDDKHLVFGTVIRGICVRVNAYRGKDHTFTILKVRVFVIHCGKQFECVQFSLFENILSINFRFNRFNYYNTIKLFQNN